MKIDDNYSMFITKDFVHLHFEEEGEIKENGKPVLTRLDWYYPNIKLALKRYVNTKITDCEEISQIVAKIEEAEQNIEKLFLAPTSHDNFENDKTIRK